MLYISSNSTADGRFSIAVTFDLGTNLDTAQVQVQNRVAIAQPRLPVRVQQVGVTVAKSVARHPDGREPLFARQVARRALHLELRQHPDQGRADARRRRRLDHGVRQPRLRDAGLARSEPAAVAQPDRDRRHRRAAGAEHPGRVGRARTSRRCRTSSHSRSRCARSGGCPTRTSSATSSSSRPATPSCGCATSPASS